MSLKSWFGAKIKTLVDEALEARAEKRLDTVREKRKVEVSDAILQHYQSTKVNTGTAHITPQGIDFKARAYVPPKGVVPELRSRDLEKQVLAMDGQITNFNGSNAVFFSQLGFPGFPFLAELTQITEYRDMSERVAAEMTRKWIKFRSISGNKDKTDRMKQLDAEMKKFQVRDLFRQAAAMDGEFGRSQIYLNLTDEDNLKELASPLILSPAKIKKDSLNALKLIEPITTYPCNYNASVPLRSDYYKPSSWFVYSQEVHATRLLQFVSRPLPDLLKPVYNFSGISLSQLAQPYVDYWLNTRNSVGNLLRNFSTTSLSTDLSGLVQNPSELRQRLELFVTHRDNQGLFVLDNGNGQNGEVLSQINTPLSGLDKLQAQAQEHMAAVAKTPLVVLLGITPSGLNASSDSEIRVFYDYVADQQEILFRPNLEVLIKVFMLHLWGEIDEDITFDFVSLYAMTEKELSLIRKSDADSAMIYGQLGAVSPEEIRQKISTDPDSGWNNLSEKMPPLPAEPQMTNANVKTLEK